MNFNKEDFFILTYKYVGTYKKIGWPVFLQLFQHLGYLILRYFFQYVVMHFSFTFLYTSVKKIHSQHIEGAAERTQFLKAHSYELKWCRAVGVVTAVYS